MTNRCVQSCPELLRVAIIQTKKKRGTDGPTDTPSYRDARTHLTRPIGPTLRPWRLVVGIGRLAVVAAVVVVAWVVAVTLAVIVVFLRMIRRVNVGFPCFMKRQDGPMDGRTYGRMDGWTPSYRDASKNGGYNYWLTPGLFHPLLLLLRIPSHLLPTWRDGDSLGNVFVSKQGRIHDIRCVPILHYAIFSDFYKSVTDRRTDGHTLL